MENDEKKTRKGRPIGALGKKGYYTEFKGISVVCTPEENAEIRRQALASGKSLSRYIVDKVLER